MEKYEQDIEELLAEGKNIQIKPRGHSMYPLLVPGRDEAIVEPVGPENIGGLKRGDVVLYRRDKSILVLHRIWRRQGDKFYLVGDNQKEIEGPLRPDQMKGIAVGFVRKGKYISARNPLYIGLAGIWLAMRPVRPVVSKMVAGIKKIFRGRK